MITKAYLVLSLSEINRLVKAARRSRKVNGSRRNHCVILHLEVDDAYLNGDPDKEQQVSSSSFCSSIRQINEESDNTEWVKKNVPSPIYAEGQCPGANL